MPGKPARHSESMKFGWKSSEACIFFSLLSDFPFFLGMFVSVL